MYVGGKSRIAKRLAETMLGHTPERGTYFEPFVGGGAVAGQMVPHFTDYRLGDLSDVALMWSAVIAGWEPPECVSEGDYAELKLSWPSATRAFVGYGGSFGGKWFGGYARGGFDSSGFPRAHHSESRRAVKKIASSLQESRGYAAQRDYAEWQPGNGDVVYCDPPYAGTQGYVTGAFDTEAFWGTMEDWVSKGARVFVSEYVAPEGWVSIWEREQVQQLALPHQNRSVRLEKLFVHHSQVHK